MATDDDWAPFPNAEAERRYMAEYARKLDRASHQHPAKTTMPTDHLSPIERDVHRGVCCAFMQRCAARGIRPGDVHKVLEAYGKLVLDLRQLPDLQKRESEHQ